MPSSCCDPQPCRVRRTVALLERRSAAETIARLYLEAGLLNEVAVDLVPVLMGQGRPYFGELSDDHPYLLGDPTTLIQGERVTHLVIQ